MQGTKTTRKCELRGQSGGYDVLLTFLRLVTHDGNDVRLPVSTTLVQPDGRHDVLLHDNAEERRFLGSLTDNKAMASKELLEGAARADVVGDDDAP